MTIKHITFGLAALALASIASSAADFGFQLGNQAKITWTEDGFWQSREGVTYPAGQYPGPEDTLFALDYDEGQGEGIPNFYLDGDRVIRRLEGSPRSQTRIISGSYERGTIGVHNKLTITEIFHLKAGTYYFFSGREGELSVEAPEVLIGSEENTTDRARIQIGAEGQGSVQFSAQKTTLSGYNPRISFSPGFDTVKGFVSLGHVIFEMEPHGVDNWSVAGIELDTSGGTLRVASLHGVDYEKRGRIEGAGMILINPAFSTLPLEKPANFNRQIKGTLALRKEGSSLQTLSANNSYTGGTEIAEGTLAICNEKGSGLGSGAVIVETHGILSGDGIVELAQGQTLTVHGGGEISPGAESRELEKSGAEPLPFRTLTISGTSVQMDDDAVFSFRVGADGSCDRVAFTNYPPKSLTLGRGGVFVNISGSPAAHQTYTLLTFSAEHQPSASGLVEGLKAGKGFEGYHATFHYDQPAQGGVGSISMTLTSAP